MKLFGLDFVRSRFAAFVHDLLWVPSAIYLAYLIRFNGPIPAVFQPGLESMLVAALLLHAIVFWYFGLYRGIWRFASVPDLVRVINAVIVGMLATLLAVFLLHRGVGVPRLIFFLYPMVLATGLALPRIAYRWLKDFHLPGSQRETRRALVVGTGPAAERLVRNLFRGSVYAPVALVDQKPHMKGREIHGIRIVGVLKDLASVITKLNIEIVLLASPTLSFDEWNDVIKVCSEARVPCRTAGNGKHDGDMLVNHTPLRDITPDDLLRRDPVDLKSESISEYLGGKRVLVTGAGGSIGSELCRQVASLNPENLLCYDNSEFNLFQISQDIKSGFPKVSARFVLGNVRDEDRVEWIFRNFRPEVVFHAAAYKHVPLLENNPIQAVQNNVYGTKVMADASDHHGSETFVLISTDKAVNPANVMGVTKRTAEIYCQNLDSRSNTRFITTRFGNVLRSAGSVVPLFEAQIAAGGPVTVTHPEITRYFMTIPESVSLILQSGAMGEGGEIFVLDMDQAIKIKDLAEQMIRLAGFEPNRDILITYTGLRPGEKLHEELFHKSEKLFGTNHPKLLLSAHQKLDWDWLVSELTKLRAIIKDGDVGAVLKQLQVIVPEFKPIQRWDPQVEDTKPKGKLTLVKS